MNIKIIKMLEVQGLENCKINHYYEAAGYPWHRGIWIECGPLMDAIGWRWDIIQKPDLFAAKCQLVKIWSFCLSHLITEMPDIVSEKNEYTKFINHIEAPFKTESHITPMHAKTSIHDTIESFIKDLINTKKPNLYTFSAMLKMLGMTFNDLFEMYLAQAITPVYRKAIKEIGIKETRINKIWWRSSYTVKPKDVPNAKCEILVTGFEDNSITVDINILEKDIYEEFENSNAAHAWLVDYLKGSEYQCKTLFNFLDGPGE